MTVASVVVVPTNKKKFEDRVKAAVAGVQKNLPAAGSLVLGGASMTQPDILKRLQDVLQLFQDVRDARSGAKQKLGTLHDQIAPDHKFYTALERSLQGYFGKGSPQLLDFGYALGVRKARTGTSIVQAKAKAQLTRVARHTMGSRQKAAIQVSGKPSVVTYSPDGKVLSGEVPVANPVGGSEISGPPASPTGPVIPAAGAVETPSGGAQGAVK